MQRGAHPLPRRRGAAGSSSTAGTADPRLFTPTSSPSLRRGPMTRHLQHPTPAATTTASMRVSRWSLRLAVPACTAGGPQASRKCSGGGRRRRRSTIHAGGAGAPSPITTPTTATRSSIFGHLPQLCVLHQRWPVTRVNGGMAPPDEPALQRARKGVQMPVQLELGPLPAPSHLLPSEWCLDLCSGQRSAPAASARRPMIWASSRPPSPPLPASLPAAAVSRARCATRVKLDARVHVWPRVRPLCGWMPPLLPLRRPYLALSSSTTHTAPFAALMQVTAPPQRRCSAA